jgi:hypothetical protein
MDEDGFDPHLALERGDLIAPAMDDNDRRGLRRGAEAL